MPPQVNLLDFSCSEIDSGAISLVGKLVSSLSMICHFPKSVKET